VKNKIWSYESPTPAFKDIKGALSFYASGVPWDCFVDDEKVAPQEGENLLLQSDTGKNLETYTHRRLLWRLGDERARGAHEGWTWDMGLVISRCVALVAKQQKSIAGCYGHFSLARMAHPLLVQRVRGSIRCGGFQDT
jgi:hypothetical protein